MIFLIGWSFDYSTEEEHWCDKRAVNAESSSAACTYYSNYINTIQQRNPIAVLHCKEINHERIQNTANHCRT